MPLLIHPRTLAPLPANILHMTARANAVRPNGYTGKHQSPRYIVNDEHKFIYAVVPKAACSSVKVALAPLFGIDPSGVSESSIGETEDIHTRYQNERYEINKHQLLRRLDGGWYADYFKFAFVRNPFDRLISCWREKLSRPASPGFVRMAYETAEGPPVELSLGMDFVDFVDAVYRIPEEDSNLHWKSQAEVLCREPQMYLRDETPMVDFVGRFENLSEDFAAVAERIGLSEYEMPHILRTGEPGSYRDAYTTRACNQAHKRYDRDCGIFGYDF